MHIVHICHEINIILIFTPITYNLDYGIKWILELKKYFLSKLDFSYPSSGLRIWIDSNQILLVLLYSESHNLTVYSCDILELFHHISKHVWNLSNEY